MALRSLEAVLTPTTHLMRSGKLLPDSTILPLVRNRLSSTDCSSGWILDGLPRTASQARALLRDDATRPDMAVELRVPYADIRSRLMYRRFDPVSKTVYNLETKPPPKHIEHRLQIRTDDEPETVERRLRVYDREMPAVFDILEEGGVNVRRVEVESGESVEEVHEKVKEVVDGYRVVLAGAPGCGKGTQGELLADVIGGVHVSTGELLREEMKREEDILKGLRELMGTQLEGVRALA